MPITLRRSISAAVLAVGLAVGPMHVPSPAAASDVTATDATAREARRVDAVPTPTLDWTPCELGECATATLPLDYDDPQGPQISVALTRIPARQPERRIGSLFLNPGGPGASGRDFPQRATQWIGQDVRDRFDLIGFDPRGTFASTTTQCFPRQAKLDKVTGVLKGMGFPVTRQEETEYTKAANKLARACSGHGRTVASSISTAEVARDLDVLRRAVGDHQLTYLGFSYGTYLGQVYANMFPSRVRALAIDGVIDPTKWVGTPATADVPMTVRMNSAPGSEAALHELLKRCSEAVEVCGAPDAEALLAKVTARLKQSPLQVPQGDGTISPLTYQGFVTTLLYALYNQETAPTIPALIATVDAMQSPATDGDQQMALGGSYIRAARRVARTATKYDNLVESVPAIMCGDSLNPRRAATWSSLSATEDARAPLFGRHWLWNSVACNEQAWRISDEDAWPGPFDAQTSATVLVVGSLHDPATSYASAQAVAQLLPNSRLLSNNNWGHTAYGLSACATSHVDRYLVDGVLPEAGALCSDGVQPFQG